MIATSFLKTDILFYIFTFYITLTDRFLKTVHSLQQKKFLELSNKLTIALYMGFPEQFLPSEIKNQRLHPFCHLQGKEPVQAHPGGQRTNFPTKKMRRSNQGSRGESQCAKKIKKILELLNL